MVEFITPRSARALNNYRSIFVFVEPSSFHQCTQWVPRDQCLHGVSFQVMCAIIEQISVPLMRLVCKVSQSPSWAHDHVLCLSPASINSFVLWCCRYTRSEVDGKYESKVARQCTDPSLAACSQCRPRCPKEQANVGSCTRLSITESERYNRCFICHLERCTWPGMEHSALSPRVPSYFWFFVGKRQCRVVLFLLPNRSQACGRRFDFLVML